MICLQNSSPWRPSDGLNNAGEQPRSHEQIANLQPPSYGRGHRPRAGSKGGVGPHPARGQHPPREVRLGGLHRRVPPCAVSGRMVPPCAVSGRMVPPCAVSGRMVPPCAVNGQAVEDHGIPWLARPRQLAAGLTLPTVYLPICRAQITTDKQHRGQVG
eukprot:1196072-Prorocentrum_minimum.AAC.6